MSAFTDRGDEPTPGWSDPTVAINVICHTDPNMGNEDSYEPYWVVNCVRHGNLEGPTGVISFDLPGDALEEAYTHACNEHNLTAPGVELFIRVMRMIDPPPRGHGPYVELKDGTLAVAGERIWNNYDCEVVVIGSIGKNGYLIFAFNETGRGRELHARDCLSLRTAEARGYR